MTVAVASTARLGGVLRRLKITKITPTANLIAQTIENIEITPAEVHRKLASLKVDKSPGPDGMHPRVLQEMANTIRYDTIGEFNVDWKAEYSALSSTRSQKKKLKQPTPVPL